MYENLRWIAGLDSGFSKTIIWAHNEHLKKSSVNGRKTLGYYLAQKLKRKFYAVGSDFGYGSFTVNSSAGVQTGKVPVLENLFLKIDSPFHRPIYFFDFKRGVGGASDIQTEIHTITANSASSHPDPLSINKEFDGFVYVPESSPLTRIRD